MTYLSEYAAGIFLNLPPFLISDFVSYDFNGQKLKSINQARPYEFSVVDLEKFEKHLWSPFEPNIRSVPQFVERYLILESEGKCALCSENKPNYEYAHIKPWAKFFCHHPHNVLRLCLDCHTTHGKDVKLLKAVKEQKISKFMGMNSEHIYDCDPLITVTSAVYALNGKVHLANAATNDAVGFVSRKIGQDRCMVQRHGVLSGFTNLIPGIKYHLSPVQSGKIIIWDDLIYDTPGVTCQMMGRAESDTDFAVAPQVIGIMG